MKREEPELALDEDEELKLAMRLSEEEFKKNPQKTKEQVRFPFLSFFLHAIGIDSFCSC
jgi:hypothetical protein